MEKTRNGEYFPIGEDGRGTYILNSKDLNMLGYINKLIEAGVTSLKIEGRAKTAYYLATVTNAYRRAVDIYKNSPENFSLPEDLLNEPYKTSHRKFNTGFYFGEAEQFCESAKPCQTHEMCAVVKTVNGSEAIIEQRNRFKEGDELEILSPSESFGKVFRVCEMRAESGERIADAKLVQQSIVIKIPFPLFAGDILRKKA